MDTPLSCEVKSKIKKVKTYMTVTNAGDKYGLQIKPKGFR